MATTANSIAGWHGMPATYIARDFPFPHLIMAYPPNRQAASLKIAAALLRYAEKTQSGRVFQAPCNVLLSRNIVVQPDIIFVRNDRRGIIGKSLLYGAPDLVVEVLSQAKKSTEYYSRKSLCFHFGVQEFWEADPARNTLETWTWSEVGFVSTGSYGESDRLASFVLPNLDLPVASLFRS
jgi:Uma2 family endonuclease